MAGATEGLFDLEALAARYGWTIGSARSFHKRSMLRRRDDEVRPGDLPEPDARFGRSPVWKLETLEAWERRRPGKGVGGGGAHGRKHAD